jgi:hypothetical protein
MTPAVKYQEPSRPVHISPAGMSKIMPDRADLLDRPADVSGMTTRPSCRTRSPDCVGGDGSSKAPPIHASRSSSLLAIAVGPPSAGMSFVSSILLSVALVGEVRRSIDARNQCGSTENSEQIKIVNT